jgi:flagellin
MLTLNTNTSSLAAQRNLVSSQSAMQKSIQRLSTGLRINSASDDAAGMAISDRMTSQINGLSQASRNANDALSVTQTAEGAISESVNILQRINTLAIQSANDSNSNSDRANLQNEVSQLVSEYDRIATQTQFNGQNLLDGSYSGSSFQIGASANQTIQFGISDVRSSAVGNRSVAGTVFAPTSGDINGLTINGTTVNVSATTSLAKVNAINQFSATTGVTASQSGNFAVSGTAASATGALAAGDISINGVLIGPVAAAASAAAQATAVAAAINSANAGVTATVGTGTNGAAANALILSNTNGSAINIAMSGAATTANTGLTAGTTAAGSNGAITLKTTLSGSITLGGGTEATIGFAAGAQTLSTNLLSGISIGTKSGANSTIDVISSALSSLSTVKSSIGAVQNRFQSTINSLSTMVENISASRSRIVDTDFAAETANMTKNQILQQAGTAMLSQANALPQSILSLLK